MKEFICITFSNYRWARRWLGGQWSYWGLSLSMPRAWVRGWERPICGIAWFEREDYDQGLLEIASPDPTLTAKYWSIIPRRVPRRGSNTP